jgi:4-hydroxy-tetrahydrodipicolinate synthase
MAARFGQVLTAMVTPFDDNGALDVDAAIALARWHVDHGNDGLVVAGTTGESPVLTDAERCTLIEAVAHAVTVPVIAGTTTNDTRHSVDLTRECAHLGITAVLCVTPYYNRPSQAGIDAHVRAVADAAGDLPVVIYDVPPRTGRKMSTPLILRLAHEVPNVVALKDAAGNPGETAHVVAAAPDGFEVMSGDDTMTLPLLAVGATSAIGVATAWTGLDHQEMFTAWAKGDIAGARAVNARMLPSFAFETGDDAPNPQPAKAMLRHLGLRVGHGRLPMAPDPDWLDARAAQVWADLEAARASGQGGG